MILTLDIGNGGIVMCCVENGARRARFLLSSETGRTGDEYAILMEALARREGLALSAAEGCVIASVVPRLTETLVAAAMACTGKKPMVVGPGLRSGLNIRMDDPAELGGDLVAAATAAAERYPLPCAFVDLGRVTAVGVLDHTGAYIGGLICPGLHMSRDALAREASQLIDVGLSQPRRCIGKSTRESMTGGLIFGMAAMLDGVLQRIDQELGRTVSTVLTGDGAAQLLPYCLRPGLAVDEDLVMRGLFLIYQKNR